MPVIHRIKNELFKNKVLTAGLIIYGLLLILFTFLPKFAVSIALIIGLSCFVFPITTLFIIFAKIIDHRFSKLAILLKLTSIFLIGLGLYFLNTAFETMPAFNEYLPVTAFFTGFFTLSGWFLIVLSWYYFRGKREVD